MIMLRKSLTVVAVMAAIGAGSVGVANAATPAPTQRPTLCGTVALPVVCTPSTGGDHRGDHFRGGNFGGFRGGNFGGGFGSFRGGNFGGTFWQRGGTIFPYSQVASSCGCSGDPVSLGYTLVQEPQLVQVTEIPVGAVATGDGSCQTLTSVNWGLPGFRRGARFFRR